jgi:hypothetical protein
MNLQENITKIKLMMGILTEEVVSDDPDYSPQTIKIIEKVMSKIDLPMVDEVRVEWAEKQGMYRVGLYYSEGVPSEIKLENELKILGTVKPFLGLPPYTFMTDNYVSYDKYKD